MTADRRLTRVGPRAAFPGVTGNKALSGVLTADNAGIWWVTCFAVGGHYRRSGLGLALLEAVEFARCHSATAVEGHPVDVAALKAARVAIGPLHRDQGHVRRRGLCGSSSHISHPAGDETVNLRSSGPGRRPERVWIHADCLFRRALTEVSTVRTAVHIGGCLRTGRGPAAFAERDRNAGPAEFLIAESARLTAVLAGRVTVARLSGYGVLTPPHLRSMNSTQTTSGEFLARPDGVA